MTTQVVCTCTNMNDYIDSLYLITCARLPCRDSLNFHTHSNQIEISLHLCTNDVAWMWNAPIGACVWMKRCWGNCGTFRRWSLVRIRGLGTGIQMSSSTLLLAHSLLPDYQCIMTVRLLFLPPCLPAGTINKVSSFLNCFLLDIWSQQRQR